MVLSHTHRVVLLARERERDSSTVTPREWYWHKETEFVHVVLVERVELAEGHRQTDRDMLAERAVLAQRERYWPRAALALATRGRA